jgi:hypothetical protein
LPGLDELGERLQVLPGRLGREAAERLGDEHRHDRAAEDPTEEAARSIVGRRVACLSAEAQMTNHAWGYTPGDTDFHDMRLLNTRLGTALLPPYIS